ncbi:hypothetical protein ACHAQA_005049 [Verticillium albo-atrum]
MKLSLSAAALLPLLASAAPPCPKSCSSKPAAFFLAGDSTTAVQSEGGGGWGNGFLSFLKPPATGTNYGRNGRTTVDFVSQGHWDLVKTAVREHAADFDVYVTIQFGHNDQKVDKNITLDMYQENLGNLAGEIKALGGTPILVTPLTRRNFKGAVTDDSLKNERLRTIAAAEETKTQWIDLYKNSKALVEAVGEQRSHDEWNLKAGDNTHLNNWGSVVFGRLVADLILEKELCLKGWIAENRTLSDEIWGEIRGISTEDPTQLVVKTQGHEILNLSASFLRDRCPQSVSPSSGNKNFATAEIPLDIAFESVQKDSDGNWVITWRNNIPRFVAAGVNTSVFTPQMFASMRYRGKETNPSFTVLQTRPSLLHTVWNRDSFHWREIDFSQWVLGGNMFAAAVLELHMSGLVIIKNVPKKHSSVKRLAMQFGGLKETFYGNTWDVISKPQAENVAYTSEYLGLHSDMLYLNSPPKLQFLHCLENDATGGESLFSDAHRTAAEMIKHQPQLAKSLTAEKMGWHYDSNGFFYQQSRPVFDLSPAVLRRLRGGATETTKGSTSPTENDGSSELSMTASHVWWSPPFQTPIRAPKDADASKRYTEWLAAASTFQNLLEDEANMVRRRLQPGDCVVFDNRRVLHGRTAFDPTSGGRHLRGAYVGTDEWASTLTGVQRTYNWQAFVRSRGEAIEAIVKERHGQAAVTQEAEGSSTEVGA